MKVPSAPQSMRAVVLMLSFFVFIVMGIVKTLVFGSQTITQEICTSGDYNIELHLSIKNPVY